MKRKHALLGLMLAMSLIIGMTYGIGDVSEAASNSYTILKGEKIQITIFGTNVRSASSSKKSVLGVKKTGSNKVNVTAKKAGKATVTVRGTNGASKSYHFTVKNPKYAWAVEGVYMENNSYKVTYSVTNKSGVYLSSAKFKYHLFDANGVEIKSDEIIIFRLLPGAKCYYTVSHYMGDGNTLGNATLTSDTYSHEFHYKYTNVSKKIKVNKVEQNGQNLNFTIKNSTKNSVDGVIDVVFYDAAGQIVGTGQGSFYMGSGDVSTRTVYAPVSAWTDYKYTIRAAYGKYIS